MNLVEEALTGHWGPKCSEYEEAHPVMGEKLNLTNVKETQ